MAKQEIKGWLFFFIITLIILSPLFNLYLIYSQLDLLLFTDLVEMLAGISLFILAGIFLWMKKPYALKFAKVVLITSFIINIFSSWIFSDFSYIFQSFGYFIIWILYLYNSKQVSQLYDKLKENPSGIQIWPILSIIYAFLSPVFGAVFAVISLINISKNKKLGGLALSIIALIISVLYLAFFMAWGAVDFANFDYVPEDIESSCSDYCYYVDGAEYYQIEYNTLESEFNCYCTDFSSNIVEIKKYPYSFE